MPHQFAEQTPMRQAKTPKKKEPVLEKSISKTRIFVGLKSCLKS